MNIRRVGKVTALLILAATALAILAEWLGWSGFSLLQRSWAVFLIVLGVEFLLTPRQQEDETFTVAWGSLSTAVIACIAAVFIFQMWSPGSQDSVVAGSASEQRVVTELDEGILRLIVENRNGSTRLMQGSGSEVSIEAKTDTWFSWGSRMQQLKLDTYTAEDALHVTANLEKKLPVSLWSSGVRLTIRVPEDHPLDIELSQRNGSIEAHSVVVRETFRAETTNGKIRISDMEGDFYVHTTNGSISAEEILGPINARTTNGKIDMDGAFDQLHAKTTNGAIHIESSVISGDWDISTTNGRLRLLLPADADFEMSARTTNGSLHADEPLEIKDKRVRGTVGTGAHHVRATTTNGELSVELR